MLTPSATFDEEHGLQVSPHRLLSSSKGEHNDYIVEKTKQPRPSDQNEHEPRGANGHQAPPDVTRKHLRSTLARNAELDSNRERILGPHQCASVGWMSSHKVKGRGFNSRPGHIQEATH